jgi:methyl-accepting chemotaxis protein
MRLAPTIKVRLALGFGLLLVVICSVGGYAVRQISRDSAAFTTLCDEDKAFALTANSIAIRILNHRRFEKDLFLNIGDAKAMQGYLAKFAKESEAIKADIARLDKVASGAASVPPESRAMLAGLPRKYEAYHDGFAGLAKRLMDGEEMTPQAANKAMAPFKESIHALETDISALRQAGQKMLDEGADRGVAEAGGAKALVLALVIGGALLAVVVAVCSARAITGALGRVADYAEAVSNGDLDARPAGRFVGEIEHLRRSLERMVGSLKQKIAEAGVKTEEAAQQTSLANALAAKAEQACRQAESARQEGLRAAADRLEGIVSILGEASERLSVQVAQSSRGAERQRGRALETASAMEEMNASVLEVAGNASKAAERSGSAREQALAGSHIVQDMVQAIAAIQARADELKHSMGGLSRRAEGIGQVLTVITDIADQTNLLALNAAIEAARAGDAGRGFAVVADEVRKLAEKTMHATKEVREAISGIQADAQASVNSVDAAVRAVDDSTALANSSGEALARIVELADAAADQVRGIAAASEQQSAASEEVNRAIQEISTISDETAGAMADSGGVVAELSRQSQTLLALIRELKAT